MLILYFLLKWENLDDECGQEMWPPEDAAFCVRAPTKK